jgi:hypothetical protein
MKAKEWLVKEGHLPADKAGKGRMSHAHHALLQDAYDNGVRFSNWSPNTVAVMVTETTDNDGNVTETVTAHRIDGYQANGMPVELAPYLYNHNTHAVYEDTVDGSKGKRRSLREVCSNDGVSLVQCTCGAPRIVATDGRGHVDVTIVAETSKPFAGNIWDAPKR